MVVLDGGLATELEHRGLDLADRLWSARSVAESPETVAAVHRDYIDAGADVVIAASYQVSFSGFEKAGRPAAEAEACLHRAVALAREVRDDWWGTVGTRADRLRPRVAASVGPYGASLADGSEYRGDDGLGVAELEDWHRRRFEILGDSGADLLACETLPSLREGRALARLLAESKVPGWLSFSCRDGLSLADGTPFDQVVAELRDTPGLLAIGVNCLDPRHVGTLLERARSQTDLPLVAYPNSGEGWDADHRCWTPAPRDHDLASLARGWHRQGGRLLGGCCRTRPADIAALRRALEPPASRSLPK